MSNSENNKSSLIPFLTGLLVGGAVGTVLGIFLSPKSGVEMRYDFSEGVGDVQNKTKQVLDETKYNLGDKFAQSKKTLEGTVKRISDAFTAGRKAAVDSIEEDKDVVSENSDNEDLADKKEEKNT